MHLFIEDFVHASIMLIYAYIAAMIVVPVQGYSNHSVAHAKDLIYFILYNYILQLDSASIYAAGAFYLLYAYARCESMMLFKHQSQMSQHPRRLKVAGAQQYCLRHVVWLLACDES